MNVDSVDGSSIYIKKKKCGIAVRCLCAGMDPLIRVVGCSLVNTPSAFQLDLIWSGFRSSWYPLHTESTLSGGGISLMEHGVSARELSQAQIESSLRLWGWQGVWYVLGWPHTKWYYAWSWAQFAPCDDGDGSSPIPGLHNYLSKHSSRVWCQ